MKSRNSGSKTSSHTSKRKGLSRTARVVGATTVGALAGGLVGTALAGRRGKRSALGKTARKLKGWVKSTATSPAVKSLVRGVARQAVVPQMSSARPARKSQMESTPRTRGKAAGKAKKK